LLSWVIEDGLAGDVSLGGLRVALATRYHDDEPGSPWSFVVYVDARAEDAQHGALVDIYTGRLGGDALKHLPWAWKEGTCAAGRDRALARAAAPVAADPRPRDRAHPRRVRGARDGHLRDPGARGARRGAGRRRAARRRRPAPLRVQRQLRLLGAVRLRRLRAGFDRGAGFGGELTCRQAFFRRREAEMAWTLRGTYFETCSCEVVCPCTTSLSMSATYDRCRVTLVFNISDGDVEGTDVGGLKVAVVADTPKVMVDGNW